MKPAIDRETGKALTRLVQAAELVSIDLVRVFGDRFHADNIGLPLVLPPKLNARVQFHMNSPKDCPKDKASFVGVLKVAWTDGDRVVAQMEIAYRAAYALKGLTAAPSQELGLLFGSEVATHHLWPFLRERSRNISMDIGMRPLLLPLRKLKLEEPPAEPSQAKPKRPGTKRLRSR